MTELLRKLASSASSSSSSGRASALGVGERGAIANMAPEYGATTGFFPLDAKVLDYLRATGRDHGQLPAIEAYARHQGLWHEPDQTPRYATVLELDLDRVELSLAGPRRPQDRLGPALTSAAIRGPIGRRGRPDQRCRAGCALGHGWKRVEWRRRPS